MKPIWLKKNGILFYGFKLNMSIDIIYGFITEGYSTPGNHSDTKEFSKFIEFNNEYLKIISYILADKGYKNKENREKIEFIG